MMILKQIILIISTPSNNHRLVYNEKREIVVGSVNQAKKLLNHEESRYVVCARGEKGEALRVAYNHENKPGSEMAHKALTEVLGNYFIPIADLLTSSEDPGNPDVRGNQRLDADSNSSKAQAKKAIVRLVDNPEPTAGMADE